ncbi:MAG: hypothetical protein QGH14_06450 [Candidatus Bathyarchaeota archaeon]|nr:hypothetical protein [Candidatus Bathyarchaeota archaeon]
MREILVQIEGGGLPARVGRVKGYCTLPVHIWDRLVARLKQ